MRIITLILLVTILYWVMPAEYSTAAKKLFTDCIAAITKTIDTQKPSAARGTLLGGAITIEDKTVDGMLTVNGSLTAKKADIQQLIVNGAAQLSHVAIHKKAHINGALDAHDTQFYDDVEVNGAINAHHKTYFYKDLTVGGQVTLKDSQAETIIVTNKESRYNKVRLEGTTRVKGSITFIAGNGIVYLTEKAVINGMVIGGKIIKQ